MSENKLLQQDEIDTLLKSADKGGQEQPENTADKELNQDDIDALIRAAQNGGQQPAQADDDKELQQDDIDALIRAAQNGGQDQPDDGDGGQENQSDDPPKDEAQPDLTVEEKDALGEIGNIAMGAAATTLSQLLNKRVQITSPKVLVTSQKSFFDQFNVPYLVIKVKFKEGFNGYNVLVIKMQDAIVMANLMMGGDGTELPDEISEMEISAAAEAMNQMIGTASTSLADLLERNFNIMPPETSMVQETEKMNMSLPFGDPIVVTYFNMNIENLLDTKIIQVLDIQTASEQAELLWKRYGAMDEDEETQHAAPEQPAPQEAPGDYSAQLPENDTVASDWAQTSSDAPAQSRDSSDPNHVPTRARERVYHAMQVDPEKLNMLLDIPLKVSVVLGRARKQIKEVLQMTPGAIVELETLVDEPVDILVNGKLVAKGEIVVVNENFGVKITNIISTRERINSLGK
ncbi:flagellar motor switch phosphatase FliY [Desulfoscipio geothermicus]|uniref:Flagellar motor switch protein FliN/FliY n=1 Tax=Desulfoscipio geothermicus DSM 3669 TaxID=1121426 RepID=A0A1I6CVI0_9FIRM|nr:flagellar motor switch phosphatase FliY [Desulfoscipio geothermicus]SFQ97170.1 flagellar motor switch protein FliN/FliY [Desulfoscipio geothermicus DSM 3669]